MNHFEEISVLFHDVYIGSARFILLFSATLTERKQPISTEEHLNRRLLSVGKPLAVRTAAATQPAIRLRQF